MVDKAPDDKATYNDENKNHNFWILRVFHKSRHTNAAPAMGDWDSVLSYRSKCSSPESKQPKFSVRPLKYEKGWGIIDISVYIAITHFRRFIISSAFGTGPLDFFNLFWDIFSLIRVISPNIILTYFYLWNTIFGPSSEAVQMKKDEAEVTRPYLILWQDKK